MDIPFDRLGVPEKYRFAVTEEAPVETRRALTRAPLPPESELGVLYTLACDDDPTVREPALTRLRELPAVVDRLTQRTHPKVLELLASLRTDLDDRICEIRDANLRTLAMIAARADSRLCEKILQDHERLLLTPDVVTVVKANPACPPAAIERAISFLRMNRASLAEDDAPAPPPTAMDLEAEIEAALRGEASPHLQQLQQLEVFDVDKLAGDPLKGFSFDFSDEGEFSLDLLEDRQGGVSDDEKISLAKRIAELSVGKKIKLADLGNKEVRAILIRDRSKMVAGAVVKSGRLTDSEVTSYAGNRNMHADVLREIAMNKEYYRKYNVQVALVNNPRTPVSISVGLVDRMMAKDLQALARNRNVTSVIFQKAEKMVKTKAKH
jgi:hypothetical protein